MNSLLTEEKGIFTAHHGGDVMSIASEFGIKAERLIDFSANINPLGPPEKVLQRLLKDAVDVELLKRYPEPDLTSLRCKLSFYNNVEENQIIIANGAAALIEIVIRSVCSKNHVPKCLLPIPAFSEYERVLSSANFRIVPFVLKKEEDFRLEEKEFIKALEAEKPELCIITNPHNPTGTLNRRQTLERVVQAAEQLKTTVLLDEAFIDYAMKESLTEMTKQFKNLIVIRSLTKFYGIPALRVGYAVASTELAEVFSNQIAAWSVTTLAANAAEEAVQDVAYGKLTLQINHSNKEFLSTALQLEGIKVFSSAANFLFIELPKDTISAALLRFNLIEKHCIIIRDCSTYSGLGTGKFARVAVRNLRDNKLLAEAIHNIFNAGDNTI